MDEDGHAEFLRQHEHRQKLWRSSAPRPWPRRRCRKGGRGLRGGQCENKAEQAQRTDEVVVIGLRSRRTAVDETALEAELLDGAFEFVSGSLTVLRRDRGETEEALGVLLAVGLVLCAASD